MGLASTPILREGEDMPTTSPQSAPHSEYPNLPGDPNQQHQQELAVFLATLNYQQRRLYAAVEANRLGRGGVRRVVELTGLGSPTVARGRRELADLLQGKSLEREPNPPGGRPRTEEKNPAITAVLEEMLSDEVAGSPEGEHKWVRSSSRNLAKRLRERGFSIGQSTVWALLKRMGFSMRTNVRRRRGITRDPGLRDEQFRYITSQRKAFTEAGLPVISVDTKKKELIGNFRNPGRAWCRKPPEVNEHDYASQAECLAVPFGVYDVVKNSGYVVVGMSHNTPEFAVTSIARWWEEVGQVAYPGAREVLILADGGGGNGSRARSWKLNLQVKLCDRFGLTVTVCHYPPGCSKWNPVEHRLFSQISKNWEGKPLKSLEIMLGYIRGTTTTTGLTVKARLDEGTYKKGHKVTREDMDKLNLKAHEVGSGLNYTITLRA
jgi:hypothetical protein